MQDQLSGRTNVPAADPAQGYKIAVDQAIVNLELAVKTARENGVELSARQRADIQATYIRTDKA